jgi:hypothetical protein
MLDIETVKRLYHEREQNFRSQIGFYSALTRLLKSMPVPAPADAVECVGKIMLDNAAIMLSQAGISREKAQQYLGDSYDLYKHLSTAAHEGAETQEQAVENAQQIAQALQKNKVQD